MDASRRALHNLFELQKQKTKKENHQEDKHVIITKVHQTKFYINLLNFKSKETMF
jgi:hypothetical protein